MMESMELACQDESKYTEYETLLLARDRYRKEGELALKRYINIFGAQTVAVFRQKIICIEKKKILSRCLMALNRGESVDLKKVQQQIDIEMAEYRTELNAMIKDHEACKKLTFIPERDALRIRQLYRRIAKKLHPDLNPLTEQRGELKELWQCSFTAYRCNDLAELEELAFLVDRALSELGQPEAKISIPDIDEKIRKLHEEIKEITTTDPYLYREIIDNADLIAEKKAELEAEMQEYKAYAEQLDRDLAQFIRDGGTFTWTS